MAEHICMQGTDTLITIGKGMQDENVSGLKSLKYAAFVMGYAALQGIGEGKLSHPVQTLLVRCGKPLVLGKCCLHLFLTERGLVAPSDDAGLHHYFCTTSQPLKILKVGCSKQLMMVHSDTHITITALLPDVRAVSRSLGQAPSQDRQSQLLA